MYRPVLLVLLALSLAGCFAPRAEVTARNWRPLGANGLALGRLVAGGHERVRPNVADVTYIVDHRTATTGRLHERSICETGTGLPVPPTSIRRWSPTAPRSRAPGGRAGS